MTKYELVKQDIEAILPNSPIVFELVHSRLVLKWLLKLRPDAGEALKIAAISHDMERAITGITEKSLKDYSKIDAFKRDHAKRSAKFVCEILRKHKYPLKTINKVKRLVENHETGGDRDSNSLKYADSFAFFEYNIPLYLKICGEERTKAKILFMYKRLSPKAKRLVGKMKIKNKKISALVRKAIS